MLFRTVAHRERFLPAIKQFGHTEQGRLDPEYTSALYVLTSAAGLYEKAKPYISCNGIRFADFLAETNFSHGEEILVCLAGNLFGQNISVSPADFMILDSGNFNVVREALSIRFKAPRIEELEEK